jgi:methionyl-tRNA synthetase
MACIGPLSAAAGGATAPPLAPSMWPFGGRDARHEGWSGASGPRPVAFSALVSYYVTTPIYYVNAQPHLGHAYTTIAADVLARHMRQRGEEVFFLSGTDEHGEPVALAAEREGVTPKELADRNAARFEALMPQLNASNDFFIRTSDPRHGERVQQVMQRVHDNGHVYKGMYEGWYCPRCADFKSENEIGPDNTCLIHKIPLDREQEENWFFRLSAFQEPLEQLYAERPDFVQPSVRFNEALAFVKQGLRDVSLSRGKLTWGVPVPWDPGHVFYVWFDALLNYVTALSFAREGEDLTDKFWPPAYHLIGKDILKFHAVYWPALLMAAGLELPRALFVHGYLLMDGEKMSKSLGNVLDPFEVMERFGTDALRYYCFREVSFGQDGSVSTTGFEARYESELANDYGNLASRTVAMLTRYRDGVVPAVAVDPALAADFEGLADEVAALLDRAELSQALEAIWVRVRRLNRYVEERAPWQLAKDPAQADALDQTLATLAEGLRAITVLLHPYMPASTESLLAALGRPETGYAGAGLAVQGWGGTVAPIDPLFPKR